MKNDFPTAPLASSLRGAGGGTVEKSFTASHTKIQTPPVVFKTSKEIRGLKAMFWHIPPVFS